ncbi:MAG: LuxR C-terminal-related transcriptional regulator [Trebonia sp.]
MAAGAGKQYVRGNRATPSVVRTPPNGTGSPVVVTVLSDDPLSADGVITHLKTIPTVRYVPEKELDAADVVLVVAVDVNEQLLAKMEPTGRAAVPGGRRRSIVLIADSVSERHLPRIFASGVVGILPRRAASRDAIAHAVTTSRAGGTMLPKETIRWLVEHNRDFADVVRTAHGITLGGLTLREADVLRLLAEGKSTLEVAGQLNFAERTIKNVIRDLLERHDFKTRTQAVAYAIRAGAI